LDHPLEERNTIEMLSITALAHLRAAIIFVIDISEQCSYSIEDQVKLFNSIKPLFTNKPLVVALNKIDVITLDNLREDAKALLRDLETQNNVYLIPMSTLTEEGVMKVKEFVRAPPPPRLLLECEARFASTPTTRLLISLTIRATRLPPGFYRLAKSCSTSVSTRSWPP
jgi:sulfate adenylyltransferase subunit 1 (EFTu-like GTPase family)